MSPEKNKLDKTEKRVLQTFHIYEVAFHFSKVSLSLLFIFIMHLPDLKTSHVLQVSNGHLKLADPNQKALCNMSNCEGLSIESVVLIRVC